ncbi:MAG: hypothetical protein JRJ58_08980 [Deltaproteobacteria bacterium]|nr:hypothetical protein [Deltaproteobacteria bacterium]
MDAVSDSGLEIETTQESVGLILATALGPHVTNFRFLDDTLEFGEALGSPTAFSNSLHNAATSHVASLLGVRGPTLTVTSFTFAFHEALALAEVWISEGRCSHVLVGAADVCGTVMEYACGEKLAIATDGKIRPFELAASPIAVPGEGSAFLVLTGEDAPRTYCRVSALPEGSSSVAAPPDVILLDADGTSGDESRYLEVAEPNTPLAAYTPLFGSILTGSSIHAAIAALMLRNQVCYPSPVADNPHGLEICAAENPGKLDRIDCIRLDCDGGSRRVSLRT